MTTKVYDEPNSDLDSLLDDAPTKPTTQSGLVSVYDQLRAELSKPAIKDKTVTKKVPARPSIELKFNTEIQLEKLDRWRIAARKKKGREEIDIRHFNEIVIAAQCIGMLFNGGEATDEAGQPLTFRHPELIESLNALDAYGAIEALFGRDADILKIGQEIIEAAGYGDEDADSEDDESDPLA